MKKLTKLFALAGLLLTTACSQAVVPTPAVDADLVGVAEDYKQNKSTKLTREIVLGDSEDVDVSKTFVQYATTIYEGKDVYVMRYATAVKGKIDTLVYQRGTVEDKDDVEPETVSYVYKSISVGSTKYYYNPSASEDGLTTDSTYEGDYYWAVYSMFFTGEEKFQKLNIPMTLTVNGEVESTRTVSLAQVIYDEQNGTHQHEYYYKTFNDNNHIMECKICTTYYTEAHNHNRYDPTAVHKAQEGNCTQKELYYVSCLCGHAGSETYPNGLKHTFNNGVCTCGSSRTTVEFDNARSNAWNVDGAEYRDKLWRNLQASNKTDTSASNGSYVAHINDVSIDDELKGKIWLEFDVTAEEQCNAQLSFRASFGTILVYKKAFKVTVNETEVDVGDIYMRSAYGDWNHWEEYYYGDIALKEGLNTIRFTIMENATMDLDCAYVDMPKLSHTHEMKQQVEGKNDVKVCECGRMQRRFDLAAAFSESWSEGTAKTNALWRQLAAGSVLDSGNWVSHINDVVYMGGNDGKYWIEVGVSHSETEDIEVELILNAGVSAGNKNWSVIDFIVNGTEISNSGSIVGNGWDAYTDYSFGIITLKANQINRIRISPNQGCEMNWCYLQINSKVATEDRTIDIINEAAK